MVMDYRSTKQVCLKITDVSDFLKLKKLFSRNSGWIFKGGEFGHGAAKKFNREQGLYNTCHGGSIYAINSNKKRYTIIKTNAEEFSEFIDDALFDAYREDRFVQCDDGKKMCVMWMVRLSPLINRVRKQFGASVYEDDIDACKEKKEVFLLNLVRSERGKGVVPIREGEHGGKWRLFPCTVLPFVDNLVEALKADQFRLLDPTVKNSRTWRFSLTMTPSFTIEDRCVIIKTVFLQEAEASMRQYITDIILGDQNKGKEK